MTSIATIQITGVAPYSQSYQHDTAKKNKEGHNDYEVRTWREKMHRDDDGNVVIPALAFKNCIAEAAKFLSIKIPGKNQSTYTKHFESGILVSDPSLILVDGKPINYEDVVGKWMNVPSTGITGSGKRVKKCFPLIPMGYKSKVTFIILDDVITPEVFRDHIIQAGQLIGIGSFRVRNRGVYGRFKVDSIDWAEYKTNSDLVPINYSEIAA